MRLPARINIFNFKATIKPTVEDQNNPKIINIYPKQLTERQINLLR